MHCFFASLLVELKIPLPVAFSDDFSQRVIINHCGSACADPNLCRNYLHVMAPTHTHTHTRQFRKLLPLLLCASGKTVGIAAAAVL